MSIVNLMVAMAFATTPTFESDVKPIFAKHCTGCHPGIIEYETAFDNKEGILSKINQAAMPPKYKFKLTDYEKNTIIDWVEGGASE